MATWPLPQCRVAVGGAPAMLTILWEGVGMDRHTSTVPRNIPGCGPVSAPSLLSCCASAVRKWWLGEKCLAGRSCRTVTFDVPLRNSFGKQHQGPFILLCLNASS